MPLERNSESSVVTAGFVYKRRYANQAVVFLCIIARQEQLCGRLEWQAKYPLPLSGAFNEDATLDLIESV